MEQQEQANFTDESMLISEEPQQHAQEDQVRRWYTWGTELSRYLPSMRESARCCEVSVLKCYLYCGYLCYSIVTGGASMFGKVWLGLFVVLGGWRFDSEPLRRLFMWVEIVMMISAIIYAGLKHLEVEDDIKVFFFLNCLLIIDIGIAVVAVVIFIALLLGLLVCVCVCLGVGYTFSSIRRSVNRKRREQFINKLCEKESETEEECAICLEKGGKYSQLECKHCFHKDCVLKWLEENKTCPICRYQLY